ncbi:MAG TPA: hypothetical protein VHA71_09570 [Rhodanobacteraceae bacterium]|jgi:hypothetical protein|nr:hypothetical protein [Rhodanobacteraceae bacterium]
MQGNQDMTLDSEQVAASAPRTTAAGLEAWLSGVHAEAPQAEAMQLEDVQIEDGMPELAELPRSPEPPQTEIAEPVEVGPVNAAEALALALVQGTFSSPRKLVGPDGAELVVDPEKNAYHFESTSLKPLAVLLEQPASAWTPIYSEALKAARLANPAQPLGRLRWYAGLIATPGILGRKLVRNERYKLTRWPETEREFPKHFRLAKEMVKDYATVDEIAAASGMPHEEVVDYFNACFADGRLETLPNAQEGDAAQGSRRERLMARLNKPLFAR